MTHSSDDGVPASDHSAPSGLSWPRRLAERALHGTRTARHALGTATGAVTSTVVGTVASTVASAARRTASWAPRAPRGPRVLGALRRVAGSGLRAGQGRHRPAVALGVVSLTIAVVLAADLRGCLPLRGWMEVPRSSAPVSNPLKGMIPFAPEPQQEPVLAESAPPYTMEWVYMPLNEVVTGPQTYDWSALESYLDAIAARGHHTVIRFYVDYPGRASALPGYLVDQGLVSTRSYSFYDNGSAGQATSVSPDYDDPDMMAMLTDFIAALGQRYDGDPRLGFITQGLVGFWGEGHTWPMDGNKSTANPRGENWMASEDNQKVLVRAWDDAFDTTPTQVRYPTSWSVAQDVGYHDDSFGYATLEDASWHFMSLMRAAGATQVWRTQPIGGEVYPDIQECVLTSPQGCRPGQEADSTSNTSGGQTPRTVSLGTSIEATHVTWLLNERAFAGSLGEQERRLAQEASASTGYQLAVQSWRVRGTDVEVRLTNDGVAPFYYDWDVEAVALDVSGTEVDRATLEGSLREVLPGKTVTFSGSLDVPEEGATVLMRAVNPLEGGVPLRFANTGQDATWEGYLTLGDLGTVGSHSPK